MTIIRVFLFIAVFLFLFSPVCAFEDTFQYYPGGDYSDNWMALTDPNPSQTTKDIYTYTSDATHSRMFRIKAYDAPLAPNIEITTTAPDASNYWAMTLNRLDINYHSHCQCGSGDTAELYVRFYDQDGYLLFTYTILPQSCIRQIGRYEFSRDSDTNQVTLKINGTSQGVIGSATSQMAYVGFRYYTICSNAYDYTYYYFDDVTNTGDIVGVCSESTTHKITELLNYDMNISYALDTIPQNTFTNGEYEIDIKTFVGGILTDVVSNVVKNASDTTPVYGFSNYNRTALTDSDTKYGLYLVYLTRDDVSQDSDYFFFSPPGEVSSISFSNPDIPIGTTETISYSIDGADFGTYNYHVRIYSTTAQIQSTQVSEESSTVTWDTTGENTGLHYAVLSRTDKTSGAYSELTYDIATLSDTIIIKGYAYDAQNESVLDNVSVNFSQASTWYNTTSNASGYYELTGLIVNTKVNVNASLVNYTHENFTFTPLSAEIYTMDLYLINNTPTYSNTTIGGLTYDYPLHQAVTNATVNIYNATWSDTTTSSTTGFYLFEELTNGSYTVNATKTDFQDSAEYLADTNNGSWLTQNILMYGIYDLTIRAQDASTDGYLSTFSVDYTGVISSTTNGSITYSGLTYGLYTFSVSATGYYSDSEDILVDSTKTETIQLTQTDSVYYVQHFVKFTVQSIWGNKYPGVSVSVYDGSSPTTTYTGTTGSDGSATFKLYETTQYRITFINATAGTSETRTLYPVDNHYYIIVSSVVGSWDTYTTPISDGISFQISKNIINSTHSYVNVSYNDSLSETTSLIIFLNQTSSADYFNQTNLDTWNAGATSSGSHSFIVEDYAGQSYLIRLLAEHTTYGTIDSTYSVSFKDDIATKFPGLPPSVWLYGSIFILLFTGGIFVHTNVERGMLVVCIMFFVFFGLGTFASLPSNIQQSMLAGGILGFILSIIANLNKSNRDEGFN
jgi:hypothetical protein